MGVYLCGSNTFMTKNLYNDIKIAYEKNLVDDKVIGMESIDFSMSLGKDNVLDSLRNDIHLQFVDDTIAELEGWVCFHRNTEYADYKVLSARSLNNTQTVIKGLKVGRNDPCPCGSGTKYKKCCFHAYAVELNPLCLTKALK